MNIALVILHADPARGGAERYTVDLAAALARRKHTVSLLASSFGEKAESVRNQLIPANGATRLGRYLHFLDHLDAHFKTESYDVIHAMLPVRHCDIYHPHAGLAAEAITRGHLKHGSLAGRTFSQLANGFNRKRRRFAAVEKRLLESTAPPLVLCLSDYVKRTVQHYFPSLPADRMAKLFNAVDLNRFDPESRPTAGTTIRQQLHLASDEVVGLFMAQDFARKGLKESILAMAHVRHAKLRLLVVGKQDPSRYQQLANSLNISNRVIFAGPTSDPYAFYQAADFFMLPTHHDPCSLVVLESLAMGVPVISTIFNGACEIMTEGVHGYVLSDPSERDTLAAAIDKMVDIENRRKMSQACLALRSSLSYDGHLRVLEERYEQCKRVFRFPKPGSTRVERSE